MCERRLCRNIMLKFLILQKNMHKYKILSIDMSENKSYVKKFYGKKLLLIMDKIKGTERKVVGRTQLIHKITLHVLKLVQEIFYIKHDAKSLDSTKQYA